MILLLFGPPGCGKGTQAVYLAERLHITAISTGEVFRAECKAGTELGKQACTIMSAGGLVPDEIVDGIVANRIALPDCEGGFLLDGYPRTLPQARTFAALLKRRGLPEPLVVHIDVADEVLVGRLTARRQCPDCKRIYNLLFQAPKNNGCCDTDGAALLTREDDTEAVIRRRLKAYEELTGPILKYYGASMVETVDGSRPAEEVAREINRKVIDSLMRKAAIA